MNLLTVISFIVTASFEIKVYAFDLLPQSQITLLQVVSPIRKAQLQSTPTTFPTRRFADDFQRRLTRENKVRIKGSSNDSFDGGQHENDYNKNNEECHGANLQRRSFLRHPSRTSTFLSLSIIASIDTEPAQARGLVRFPVKEGQLLNNYHFMRAGESLLEEEGVWSTNPLFL